MKITVCVGFLALGVLQARPALADETYVRHEAGRNVTMERDWYGDSLLIVYGTAYGVGALGYVMRLQDAQALRAVGFIFLAGGAITALIGAPAVHWSNDEIGTGFLSMGGQVGSALAGVLVGIGIRESSDSGNYDAAPFIGAVVGHAAFALVDSFVLARRERAVSWETVGRARGRRPLAGLADGSRGPMPQKLTLKPGAALVEDGVVLTLDLGVASF